VNNGFITCINALGFHNTLHHAIFSFMFLISKIILFLTFVIGFNLKTIAQKDLPNDFLIEDEEIKNLKSFWVTVFTEFDDQKTLIHDKSNPNIIYEVVSHEDFEHFKRTKKVNKTQKKIEKILKSIAQKKLKKLSLEEREILGKIPTYLKNEKSIKMLSLDVRYQQGMSNRFYQGLQRSMYYMDEIKSIFEENGLPLELVFLPHVESSFNYEAYSKVGAAGIWQLMPRTAKQYKLKVTKYVDERLDPLASTRVAARLLKDYFRMIKNWPLTITAYNHGPTNIVKAMKKTGSDDYRKVFNAISKKSFQFASKNFYPSYLAAIEIAQNPSKYYDGIFMPAASKYKEFILDRNYKYQDLTEKFSMNLEDFKKFNPHLTNALFKKNIMIPKGICIKLPLIGPGINLDKLGTEIIESRNDTKKRNKVDNFNYFLNSFWSLNNPNYRINIPYNS